MKKCKACEKIKTHSEFYQDRNGYYFPKCKSCHSAVTMKRYRENPALFNTRVAEWRLKNPERTKANAEAWAAANPDKMRAKYVNSKPGRTTNRHKRRVIINASFDLDAVATTLELARIGDKYLDAYTGQLIDNPTIEHIIPLSRGGDHNADNMCITSFSNNASKKATPMIIWMARQRRKELGI